VPGVASVERKYFGWFTERTFWIEMIKIYAGAEWLSTSEGARRVIVALSGTAKVDRIKIGRRAAIQADTGEKLHISATEEMVLYIVGLPPVQLRSTPSDQFDLIESDGAIQFENAAISASPRYGSVRRETITVLSLNQASKIVDAALSKTCELTRRPLTITVLDPGGHPIVVKREDGAGILRPQLAHAKAWGCLGTGAGGATGALDATRDPAFFAALAAISEGRIASSRGGVLIRDEQEELLGAIGVSGDRPEKDEVCAVAGVESAAWSRTRVDRAPRSAVRHTGRSRTGSHRTASRCHVRHLPTGVPLTRTQVALEMTPWRAWSKSIPETPSPGAGAR
jgi:uncharacterized protein GlcG (DUF336 family)